MSGEYKQAQEQLTEILESASFSQHNWINDVLRGMKEWINEKISSFLQWISLSLPGVDSNIPSWALPAFLLLLFLFLFWWVGRRLSWGRSKDQETIPGHQDAQPSSTRGWESGRELAALGEYREAIHVLFLAVLARLEESEALALHESKSNWDYRNEVKKNQPSLADSFTQLTILFDRIWFGKGAVNEKVYQRFSHLATLLYKGGGPL